MTHKLTAPDIGDNNNTTDIQRRQEDRQIQAPERASAIMDISELKRRRQTIREVYEDVMIDGLHYGKPFKDSSKPTLLKAGGEVLANTFMLSPKYVQTLRELQDGHREVEFCCQLFHIPTGHFIGEGYGSCTTMESKYRYRSGDEATDIAIEPADWNIKEQQGNSGFFEHLKKRYQQVKGAIPSGRDIGMTKEDGNWFISIRGKVENPDIANEYNTVLKIAKKRALNDAVLTATGASEYFTQDVEDILANEAAAKKGDDGVPTDSKTGTPDQKSKSGAGRAQNQRQAQRPARHPDAITDKQIELIEENSANFPQHRKANLMQIVNSGKISAKDAAVVVEFLISYDQLYSGMQDFSDSATHNTIPNIMWECLEATKKQADLQPISETLSNLINAEMDEVNITADVTVIMNRHLDTLITDND